MSLLGVSSSFREAPWRKSMLQLLRGRDEREVDQFEDYEKAISHVSRLAEFGLNCLCFARVLT